MRTIKASLLALGLVAALTTSSAAQQVGFDDVTSAPMAFLSNGYQGLNWSNAFVMDGVAWYGSAGAAGGFNAGLTSGKYVMSNAGAQALAISSLSSFNLLGGNFAASWTNGLTVTAIGYSGANVLYNQSFNLNWSSSTYIDLGMYGIDRVVFTNSGGTVDARFNSDNNRSFVVDDMTFSAGDAPKAAFISDVVLTQDVVPEPMTLGLVGLGLLVVGGLKSRRKHLAA
ncbi:MAG: PEP-CTERM sorting domain-containing protein [Gemmatimonadaceae bacterium]